MKKYSGDYKGIYAEMLDILGEDTVKLIYRHYKG